MAVFTSHIPSRRFGLIDILVIAFVFALLFSVLYLGAGMVIPFSPENQIEISTDPADLPYYAGRSLLRMFIAYGASLLFTFIYGSIAAKSRTAEKVLVPLLDILQSVPVLGFLSVTITMFIGLFPNSLLGVELASIFAIFTGQCWNMTFSFYHSLTTLPQDLKEAAAVLRLNWWQRFIKLEVPFAMISLVWNSMMSFGGAWFFLAASEAITVLNQDIRLPGVGSFMAAAVEKGNMSAVGYAILTMIIMIMLVDQLFWRPIVVWSQKFKMERTEAIEVSTSLVYDILKRAVFVAWAQKYFFGPITQLIDSAFNRCARVSGKVAAQIEHLTPLSYLTVAMKWALLLATIYYVGQQTYQGILLIASMGFDKLVKIITLGFYTLGRVTAASLIGVLWTVPVGVWIGTNPRLSKFFQPIVQVTASFPANMIYPFVVVLYLNYGINFELGSILLMMLGTQWYILFNVIAGAMAIPTDLKEASTVFKLSGWQKWRKLILPAIFPHLITGCITASGGAWNASIVSELVTWKDQQLNATGLGNFIGQVTEAGDWSGILGGIIVMCAFVIIINRLFWRRLYHLAETKYHLN
ncbi:binding-protein-dependent transport systems inner membrane component [Thermosinus carboxydivorans Nor1]|uniref:Binding-protein-dependent transport systems inner membrane component n=1 Tax=Thermosinus carboxydivorans Nor1 TaxID=401526 RepID=A1HSH8_9FIRM|nr:ABC transporter permease subunit [Thermosinus carboxydivorans]EAX47041.1 binding-protein-dependent transport systems inner membrane component [Thermosinus carboxydivorans Nor1]